MSFVERTKVALDQIALVFVIFCCFSNWAVLMETLEMSLGSPFMPIINCAGQFYAFFPFIICTSVFSVHHHPRMSKEVSVLVKEEVRKERQDDGNTAPLPHNLK